MSRNTTFSRISAILLPKNGPSSMYRFEALFLGTPLKRGSWSIFWARIRVEKFSDFGLIIFLVQKKNGSGVKGPAPGMNGFWEGVGIIQYRYCG